MASRIDISMSELYMRYTGEDLWRNETYLAILDQLHWKASVILSAFPCDKRVIGISTRKVNRFANMS